MIALHDMISRGIPVGIQDISRHSRKDIGCRACCPGIPVGIQDISRWLSGATPPVALPDGMGDYLGTGGDVVHFTLTTNP